VTPSQGWREFLSRLVGCAPLTFVNGMRLAVSKGVAATMHSHRAVEIVYHPSGRGVTHLDGGRAMSFKEGSVVIYSANERHDQIMDCEGEDLCVQLAIPQGRDDSAGSCFEIPMVADGTLIEEIQHLSRCRVQTDPIKQAIVNLRATSTLMGLIQLAFDSRDRQKAGNSQRHVLKAEQYIQDHFSTVSALGEVAAHAGISHDHLRHEFRAMRGKSLVRYLNEIRIERARTLLVHSSLSLSQIATMCGFKDEYYFSAVFRKLAGLSPGRYRAVHS
jgi:AraC-like DNA-binding protein